MVQQVRLERIAQGIKAVRRYGQRPSYGEKSNCGSCLSGWRANKSSTHKQGATAPERKDANVR